MPLLRLLPTLATIVIFISNTPFYLNCWGVSFSYYLVIIQKPKISASVQSSINIGPPLSFYLLGRFAMTP